MSVKKPRGFRRRSLWSVSVPPPEEAPDQVGLV